MVSRLARLAAWIGGALGALSLIAAADAAPEKRLALVVGNSTYQNVPQLPNPKRDASAVAKMFRDAGFEVATAIDVGNLEFKRAIRKFEADADQADIAVVYYAGHGIEIGGTNYLIPIDARLASDRDADDEAIPLERMVSSADGAQKLRVIILDACRDNPFTTRMRRERKVANRAVSSGLGKVEPTSTDTLIAYAAKAGSTAEDGDGLHSPFTAAVLKNLTVPGLDIRLAFGRVRDEVMKATGGKQEPFVYGSLGGGNISLVPAPVVATAAEPSAADIKADYDLVAKIGSRRAWEVFLGTYKTGFYADLARAQLASLNDRAPAEAAAPQGNVEVASVGPATIAPGREATSRERLEWDKVKDSTDPAAIAKFIARFPNSPLAITAQQRHDMLKQAQQEREQKARAEREAAQKAAEEIRRQAEQKKAELEAQRRREDEERRARAAEAEQKAKAAEAERRAAEAARRAEEAARTKAAAEAAALRAESERQARAAEEERRKAESAAAKEAVCKNEQQRFESLLAKGSEGSGVDDMRYFVKSLSCDRLRPQATASLEKFAAEAAKRAAAMPNSPELVRAAQTQLARLGCTPGKPDGQFSAATKSALERYFSQKGKPAPGGDKPVTEALVADLSRDAGRVCPLECKAGEVAKGETCVASEKPKPPATASRRHRDDDEDDRPAARKPQPKRQAERESPRRQESRPQPAARQQAYSRPGGAGGGGGGGHTMIGVGF